MQQTLLEAADAVGRMIASARADLGRGRAVDLTHLEAVAAGIYRLAAQNPDAARAGEQPLTSRLGLLVDELAALEADLKRHYGLETGA